MHSAILPHPLLSATLVIVWILLANSFSPGNALLAAVIGILVPKLTAAYWPSRPRLRRPLLIMQYAALVLYDIVVSNVQVARLVLFRAGGSLRSRFVCIPLQLRSPEGIAVLAGTITMTPGTVTADVSPDGKSLSVHCLEVTDQDALVARIKTRYERRLRRIFV
jgi:multicomponent K+:H+ antiporter subunit E